MKNLRCFSFLWTVKREKEGYLVTAEFNRSDSTLDESLSLFLKSYSFKETFQIAEAGFLQTSISVFLLCLRNDFKVQFE